MALALADRVQETTTTTGTGTITLAGAVAQCQSFAAGVGSGNTTYYTLLSGDGTAWEVGLGTIGGTGPYTLARTTIFDGSSGTSPVSLTGTSIVFCDLPASKASAGIEAYFAGVSNALALTTSWSGWQTADSMTLNLPASGTARQLSVNAMITWETGTHGMRGGIALDGTIVFPAAYTGANPGFQSVSAGPDGLYWLSVAGAVVTVPGDGAAHAVEFQWQFQSSASLFTVYDRWITGIVVG